MATTGGDLHILRRPDGLVIASGVHVALVPVTGGMLDPDLQHCKVLGPRIMDVEFGRDSRSFRITRETYISAVIPGEDRIYVGTTMMDGISKNRGALLVWDPVSDTCEAVCDSSSLTTGMLNDCESYLVEGGVDVPDKRSIYVYLDASPAIKGTWEVSYGEGAPVVRGRIAEEYLPPPGSVNHRPVAIRSHQDDDGICDYEVVLQPKSNPNFSQPRCGEFRVMKTVEGDAGTALLIAHSYGGITPASRGLVYWIPRMP
jgi:hypothetical protein